MTTNNVEGRLVRLCIEAASESRENVEKWRMQRRTLERLPVPLAEALLHQLLRRRLLFPSLLEVFQHSVEHIDFKAANFVDAEWMAYLGSFRYLQTLNIAGCKNITSSSLWALTGMSTLKELDLSRCCKLTDSVIEHILSLASLKKLSLAETGVTSKAVTRLSSLRKICALDLGGLPVTDQALCHLKVLTHLEYLDLWGSQVTNQGAEVFKMFPNLDFLNVAWTNISKLPSISSLTCLNMSNCAIESLFGGAENRACLSKLLFHSATFLDPRGMFSSLDLSSISFLDLSSSSVEDFFFLQSMVILAHLDLNCSKLTDSQIYLVKSVGENLRFLNLGHTNISSLGVAELSGWVPNLEILSLAHTAVDDNVLLYLSLMPSLSEIDLSHTNIKGIAYHNEDNRTGVFSLAPLQDLSCLEMINLEDTLIRDKALSPLLHIRELKCLFLRSDFLSDTAFQILSLIPKLRYLSIQGAMLTDDGLHLFKPCEMLQVLDLRECWLLTEDAVVAFSEHYPQISMRHEFIQKSNLEKKSAQHISLHHITRKVLPSEHKRVKALSAVYRKLVNHAVTDQRIKYSICELLELQNLTPSQDSDFTAKNADK